MTEKKNYSVFTMFMDPRPLIPTEDMNQAQLNSFSPSSLKQEEVVHVLGTISSGSDTVCFQYFLDSGAQWHREIEVISLWIHTHHCPCRGLYSSSAVVEWTSQDSRVTVHHSPQAEKHLKKY